MRLLPSKRAFRRAGFLLKVGLVSTLVFELAVPVEIQINLVQAQNKNAAAMADRKARIKQYNEGLHPTTREFRNEIFELQTEPLFEQMGQLDEPEFQHFEANDPLIDKDPFFLRGQYWANTPVTTATSDPNAPEILFAKSKGQVALQVVGSPRSLVIQRALHPFYASNDFVFLAADEKSGIFSREAQGLSKEDVVGEGIFVIVRSELEIAEDDRQRVPVYFVPLPGGQWTGNVRAEEVPGQETIVFRATNGDVLPFLKSDIQFMVGAGRTNFSLAMGMRYRDLALRLRSGEEAKLANVTLAPPSPEVVSNGSLPAHLKALNETVAHLMKLHGVDTALPPVGSTAGFGLLFTGFDLENPARGVFQPGNRTANFGQKLEKFVADIFRIGHARAADTAASWAKLAARSVRVLIVTVTAGVLAVAFKYLVPGLRRNPRASIGSIYAHNMTFLATAPYVYLRDAVYFFLDRWSPNVHYATAVTNIKGDNHFLRRLVNGTIGWFGKKYQYVPVNWWTVIAGTLFYGGVEVGSVAAQLLWAIPQANAALLPYVHESLATRIEASLDSENLKEWTIIEIVRNLLTYLSRGASFFSTDMVEGIGQRVAVQATKEANDQVFANPDERKAWVETRTRELEALEMKKMELPGEEDFLFGCMDVSFAVRSMLGYTAEDEPRPSAVNDRLQAEGELPSYDGSLHPGAIIPALKSAIAIRKRRLKQNPKDQASLAALRIHEQSLNDASLLSKYVLRGPKHWLWNAIRGGEGRMVLGSIRRLRQAHFALTYAGAGTPEAPLHNVPSEWVTAVGQEAADLAALDYQDAFTALRTGDHSLIVGIAPQDRARLQAQTSAVAHEQAIKRAPGAQAEGGSESLKSVYQERAIATAIRQEAAGVDQIRDPRGGWYAHWQLKRARNNARQKFAQTYGHHFDPSTTDLSEQQGWRSILRDCILNQAGIYPDWSASTGTNFDLATTIDATVRKNLDKLQQEPSFQKLMASHPEGARQLLEDMAGIFATQAYLDETVESPTMSQWSTAQPGLTQWLRVTAAKCVGNPKWAQVTGLSSLLTFLARSVDALTPPESRKLGLLNFISRNVPFVVDAKNGFMVAARLWPTYLFIWYTNWFIWANKMNYGMFLMLMFVGFPVMKFFNQNLPRLFKNHGAAPMGNMWYMLLFALAYSWGTALSFFPMTWFEADWMNGYDTYVAPYLPDTMHWCGRAISAVKSLMGFAPSE